VQIVSGVRGVGSNKNAAACTESSAAKKDALCKKAHADRCTQMSGDQCNDRSRPRKRAYDSRRSYTTKLSRPDLR
jgi:hypothetical protein